MKKVYQIPLFFFLLFLLSCGEKELKIYGSKEKMIEETKPLVQEITCEDFKKVIESDLKYFLIDCREESEFDSACIPGAINIPRGLLEFQIGNKVDSRRADVYIYCSDSQRSILAAGILPELKFANVKVITEGFDGWKKRFPDMIELNPDRGGVKTSVPVVSSGGCGG
ncbi:MAG: rhodanese-like domain-containing protein [Bacteroidota bacterium]